MNLTHAMHTERSESRIGSQFETGHEALRRFGIPPYALRTVGAADEANRRGPRISVKPNVRILLADMDGGLAQRMLREDGGFEIRAAQSLARVWEELPRVRPEAIVVAVDDPGIVDVADIRNLLSAYRAPLLVISAPVDEQRLTAMIKAGAGGYLLRDDLARLPDAVRELLRGGVPMSAPVSQLVLGRARRSSAKMAAVREGGPAPEDLITKRQREILSLLARGHSYEDIGTALELSINTVRSHVRTIYERLGASTKVEAVIAAIDLRLIDRDGS